MRKTGLPMRRNNKIIILSAVIAAIAIGVFFTAYFSGTGISNRLMGKSGEQSEQTKDNAQNPTTEESTNRNSTTQLAQENTEQSPEQQNPTAEPEKKEVEKVKARAVYLTGISAGISKKTDQIIQLSKTTELNAVVIDIKEDGKVNYESQIPEVRSIGAFIKYYKPEEVIKKLHENNIYVIGRVVVFKDSYLATKRADLAIKQPNGQLWKENKHTPWTNPYNQDVWKYNIDIAKEAIDKGFDEIQFDYVRFPTARKADIDYGANPPSKVDTISGFLSYAKKELNEGRGVPISADVFGIIFESQVDGESIGQLTERVGIDLDYISPMIYPSHYANNSKGVMGNGVGQSINGVKFTAPDLKPYDVVYQSLLKGKGKTTNVPGYKATMRPYLQAFTATYLPKGYYQTYGPEQIRQQMKAVYDAGYEEWILWDPRNNYQESYFEKKP
jgi:hypothetical protein